MYSLVELVQTQFEIAFVECLYRFFVQDIGLRLLQRALHGLRVVKVLCESQNFGADEDVAALNLGFQLNAFERCASAQSNVGLSASKDASAEVYHHARECESLTLVDCYCPRQFYRELAERAEFFLLYLLFGFVVCVSHVAPFVFRNPEAIALFGFNEKRVVVYVNIAHYAERSVYPSFFKIVFDEENLRSLLYREFLERWQAAFGKFAADFALEGVRLFVYGIEFALVYVVNAVAARAERYKQFARLVEAFVLADVLGISCVQQLKVVLSCAVGAYVVQHRHESRVALAVDLC